MSQSEGLRSTTFVKYMVMEASCVFNMSKTSSLNQSNVIFVAFLLLLILNVLLLYATAGM